MEHTTITTETIEDKEDRRQRELLKELNETMKDKRDSRVVGKCEVTGVNKKKGEITIQLANGKTRKIVVLGI